MFPDLTSNIARRSLKSSSARSSFSQHSPEPAVFRAERNRISRRQFARSSFTVISSRFPSSPPKKPHVSRAFSYDIRAVHRDGRRTLLSPALRCNAFHGRHKYFRNWIWREQWSCSSVINQNLSAKRGEKEESARYVDIERALETIEKTAGRGIYLAQ